jgi:DNA-binding MarR family transcriptional regulator
MLIISEQTIGPHENPVYRVAASVRKLNAALAARMSEHLAATGLTLSQMLVVKALAHGGPMTITELADELCVSKPTAVGIVDRLEKQRLVRRIRDGNGDRREVKVGFAPGSDERLRGVRSAVDGALGSAFSDLSGTDFETLERALETALKALARKD